MSSLKKKERGSGILGIDAGGTFTDLAFLDGNTNSVKAKVKIPTAHDDLVSTIDHGLNLILEQIDASVIHSLNLATTLATNAIVENKLHPAALVLIGYEKDVIEAAIANNTFNTQHIILISGGHDNQGNEAAPLDVAALRREIMALPKHIEAVAVSGFFSIRNTNHEILATSIIKEVRPDVFISYGHDLSTDLNAVKRATTTLLNAGLIPIVIDLLTSVEKVCKSKGINIPITIVRGDGTIVSAEWAKSHPVEMILSGPAASACGGYFLANADKRNRDSWVVDIGGTTTDIIHLDSDGKPSLLEEGATVADHKTLIKAIDIYTFGLGGDSRVLFGKTTGLSLSNRRVRPLCSLATEYPEILNELRELEKLGHIDEPLFIIPGKQKPSNDLETSILRRLTDGPHHKQNLLKRVRLLKKHYKQIDLMEEKGMLEYASFTPTDALYVLGLLHKWNKEAADLGAELMVDGIKNKSAQDIARSVIDSAVKTICAAIFRKCLSTEGIHLEKGGEGDQIMNYALSRDAKSNPLNHKVQLKLDALLIGAGAPSWAFVPSIGEILHENASLPADGDVAGAVGAAIGSFSMTYPVKIMISTDHKNFRVYYPLGTADFDDLEKAVNFIYDFMVPWLIDRAKEAGAQNPKISWSREDAPVSIGGLLNKVPLWSNLSFFVTNEE